MDGRALDYVALVILIFVLLTIIYAILYIHDIPYEIAKKRKHPHQDAIHTAGWVSLFLMHTIWPFLWIWATLYKPDRGWGVLPLQSDADDGTLTDREKTVAKLLERISDLEEKGKVIKSQENEKLENILTRLEQLEKQIQDSGEEV